MLALPVLPQLVRTFKKLRRGMLNQGSSLITHPSEAEGKKPYRLFRPNLEEASVLAVAWKKYRSLKE